MNTRWKFPPEICQWDITAKCNLKCPYCRATESWDKSEDLDFSVVISILKELFSFAPNIYLAFAGGEPLARNDLKDIMSWVRDNSPSVKIELLSNGTLINGNNIFWLKELVDGFNISLDGGTKETNDAIRGKGSFGKTLRGIFFLTGNNLKVAVRMTFFHQAEKEVQSLMKLLPEIGVDFFNFRYVVPVGRARATDISFSQYQRLSEEIIALGKELNITVGFSDPFPNILTDDSLRKSFEQNENLKIGKAVTGCSIGFSLLYLDPQGIVKACPYLPVRCADAKKVSLKQIWFENEALEKLRRIRSCLEGKCGKCEYKFACGGCRGAAFANGNFLGEDPRCWK